MNTGNLMVLVDDNDKVIWTWEKMDIHRKWILHRAISVLIFNSKWEMLLQQRALSKYHCWWLWTNATCTHPYLDEEVLDAAHRRLQEEMWFNTALEEIFQFQYIAKFDNGLIENEYDHVFKWIYDWEITSVNPDEVNDYKWIDLKTLVNDIEKNPSRYTEWFKIILNKYIELN
jgi:isopentenyl-diphosphate delta-isomerase